MIDGAMNGWCPVDDRIVEARHDGTCPHCGTALLDVPVPAKPSRGEWVLADVEAVEPDLDETAAARPPKGSRRMAILSAAALVVVFAGGALAGAVFTSDRTPPAPSRSARIRPFKGEWGPFPVVTQNGVALRLLSVRQNGAEVGLTFDPIGGRHVANIRSLSVEVLAGAPHALTGNQVRGPYIDVQATLPNPS